MRLYFELSRILAELLILFFVSSDNIAPVLVPLRPLNISLNFFFVSSEAGRPGFPLFSFDKYCLNSSVRLIPLFGLPLIR